MTATLTLALATLALAPGGGASDPHESVLKRPAEATGTVVIPERFLRRWDPVTVFFTRDLGPSGGGPEDDPGRVVTVTPPHPGAFSWLDARTLQFKPAEPWPALARFTWKADGVTATLSTLMSTPTRTVPAQGAEGLSPVDEIALVFPEPLDVEALAEMSAIEIRPLPGVGGGAARTLTSADFDVKAMERPARGGGATYVLALREPIPLGVRATLRLRLALDDAADLAFREVSFSTAEPFRVTSLGCRARQYPITPDGSRYSREQAIDCGAGSRSVVVELSATPAALGPVEVRNLVGFTPAVEELEVSVQGRTVEVTGDFARDTLYRVRVTPAPISDARGRALEMRGPSEVYVHFPRQPAFVRWGASHGIVERFGPQMFPVLGRGQERVDLRIHAVAPLDRSFWPFPDQPVPVDESRRPPGPGEELGPPDPTAPPPSTDELQKRIQSLGSPPFSALEALPLRREGGSATFGLDLAPHLAGIAGAREPGTYLVGLRDLAAGTTRHWARIQVTDLSLTTIEEAHAVRFVVTSLSSGEPVSGATVRVEGIHYGQGPEQWMVFGKGTTNAEGAWLWTAPGRPPRTSRVVRRIVVDKAPDILVLDPSRPPDEYADNQWSRDSGTWLQWAVEDLAYRGPQPEELLHIFTERPVYRPEEEVHIKGYLRHRVKGRLSPMRLTGWLVVEGPGDLAWSYPLTTTAAGSFYHLFHEEDLPTGTYRARVEDGKRTPIGEGVSFRVEAYRIPRFEIRLHGPEQASLDEPFEVSLTAAYYAGGRVGGQPVQWRVTQFPLTWTPGKRAGFLFSSDGRFSRTERFESTARLEKEDTTDESGESRLALDPTIEPNAQPRSYVVEATVTGPDDQTVTATRSFRALPPFVLGLKAPRFVPRAREIVPELIVLGPDGTPVSGKEVTVRLLRREWHSTLRASDFSDGVARYLTDVVDTEVLEKTVTSAPEPLAIPLPIDRAGVYVVDVEARDKLDRAQAVRVDLYAGGDEPVTWPKPKARVFTTTPDESSYDPGTTASLVLQSPFQTARALAVIEAPEGNRYRWVDIRGGSATFELEILGTYTPRLPVHFVLMRGRLPGTAPQPGNGTDLGKPTTLATTTWLEVNPVDNRVEVQLDHPTSARPGQTIEVAITLADPGGHPLPGEVTLWLVDQAVLALGREQRLDPLPDFITAVRSFLTAHDTRNLAFGFLPFAPSPGGDEGLEEEAGLLDRATVRKDFKSVPYFDPAIAVGPDGQAVVTVQLPDNLTNFKLRAKVASGPDRFGFAVGHLAVRLPVIVQPALPRFVRPGDRFEAAAIGRIVEGEGGPGATEVRATGVEIEGPTRQSLTWVEGRPERIAFPVEVTTPPYDAQGRLERDTVTFRLGVERDSDGASDAFEVALPIRADREPVTLRSLEDLEPGGSLAIPALSETPRAGTLRRSVLVSSQPALVRMAAALDVLLAYPYGCTEQQISQARAYVAVARFRELLEQDLSEADIQRAMRSTLEWLPTVVDDSGLVAYWPGSPGSVSLTAWVVQFLVEARDAGFVVDQQLLGRLMRSLEQALRSDYSNFIDGEAFIERAWALVALAQAGRFDSAYAAELARKAQLLDLEGVAEVVQSFAYAGETGSTVDELAASLWDGVIFRLHQGNEIYGGLQERRESRSGLILPSETRTLAEMVRALARVEPDKPRLGVLTQALVTLGRDDGWGTTNANAAALLALSERLQPSFAGAPRQSVRVTLNGRQSTVDLGPDQPVGLVTGSTPEAGQVALPAGAPGPVVARVKTRYVPEAVGSQVEAHSAGFVVSRTLLKMTPSGAPPERLDLDTPGTVHTFTVGDVIEDHAQVVNPKMRHYVAIVVPLAAGVEPLNPRLATAPPEARPAGQLTLEPTYAAYLDDRVAFYYNSLPAGTYDFYFRTRATTPGRFTQPAARAQMMYDAAVVGYSNGAAINVEAPGQE